MPHCPRCRSAKVKKDGRRPVGRQRFRCHTCLRTFTTRTYTPFARHRWPTEVILTAVRWYFGYRLSAADIRDLLAERHIDVSARTILSWAHKFGPLLRRAAHRSMRSAPGHRWWCDETYVRVGGRWPVGILVSGCRRRGPGDGCLAADSARLGQRRSLLHPSHRATANGPHGNGHRQAPSLCRGCTKACERGYARPDRVAPSQRADDDQSDRVFASSYQRPPAPDARVALDRHGAALARGHRNYPGHPSRRTAGHHWGW